MVVCRECVVGLLTLWLTLWCSYTHSRSPTYPSHTPPPPPPHDLSQSTQSEKRLHSGEGAPGSEGKYVPTLESHAYDYAPTIHGKSGQRKLEQPDMHGFYPILGYEEATVECMHILNRWVGKCLFRTKSEDSMANRPRYFQKWHQKNREGKGFYFAFKSKRGGAHLKHQSKRQMLRQRLRDDEDLLHADPNAPHPVSETLKYIQGLMAGQEEHYDRRAKKTERVFERMERNMVGEDPRTGEMVHRRGSGNSPHSQHRHLKEEEGTSDQDAENGELDGGGDGGDPPPVDHHTAGEWIGGFSSGGEGGTDSTDNGDEGGGGEGSDGNGSGGGGGDGEGGGGWGGRSGKIRNADARFQETSAEAQKAAEASQASQARAAQFQRAEHSIFPNQPSVLSYADSILNQGG